MSLTYFTTISPHRGAPRLWVEGHRIQQLGFARNQPINVRLTDGALHITPATTSRHKVSSRRANGEARPIIDINSRRVLGTLCDAREVKVVGSYRSMVVLPTLRAASILNHGLGRSCYRVLDLFCGGGTLSDAFGGTPRFKVIAGVEREIGYADEFARKHPDAEIIIGDFRSMHPYELPEFDILLAGIPCTEHSNYGITKKSLKGQSEFGEAGDLFIPTLSLVAARMPAACIFENVPRYGNSPAGRLLVLNLRRLGYDVRTTVLRPSVDYGEPSTRRRWVCVATLKPGFVVTNPHTPFAGTVGDFCDAPDAELDQADVERIAVSFAGLRAHAARHGAKGNGFVRSLKVLDRNARECPTFCRSYHKINNSGAYLMTEYGPRMFRPAEVCRIHGQTFVSQDASTVYQMAGQGVLTRLFAQHVATPLAEFLP